MDRLLLHGFNLQRVQLLVEHLANVHHHRLVDLLPQMGTEDLDQRDLEGRNLSMHEDAGQVKLHLERNTQAVFEMIVSQRKSYKEVSESFTKKNDCPS